MKIWRGLLFIAVALGLSMLMVYLKEEVLASDLSYTVSMGAVLLGAALPSLFSMLAGFTLFFRTRPKGAFDGRVLLFALLFGVLSLSRVAFFAFSLSSGRFFFRLLVEGEFLSVLFGFAAGSLFCFLHSKKEDGA